MSDVEEFVGHSQTALALGGQDYFLVAHYIAKAYSNENGNRQQSHDLSLRPPKSTTKLMLLHFMEKGPTSVHQKKLIFA